MRLIAGLIVLLTCAACTIGGTQPQGPATEAPATAPAPQTTEAASPAPTELPVLASRTTSYDGVAAEIAVNQVISTGGVTTVTWTLTNKTDRPIVLARAASGGVFSDGQQATIPGSNEFVPDDSTAADGAYLIDAVNKQRYLPARDSQGACVCSMLKHYTQLEAGNSMMFSATFKAVPAGVDTVGVFIPGAGTFTDVPVQR